jgi:hypothetical protein
MEPTSSTPNVTEPQQRYSVAVWENGTILDRHPITDPFIRTTVRPRGWRVALMVLLGRYEVRVTVSADSETVERVLELDPDYLGAYGSNRRKAWDASLNEALASFANQLDDRP